MRGRTNLKSWKAILVVLAALSLCATAQGRTIYVDNDGPADFNNIQAAIDDSNDGDTVIISDGTYTGNGNRDIDFLGKAITVRSENGPEACIIDCNGSETEPHCGFYFHSGEDGNSIVDGFTITNGYADDGIYPSGMPPIQTNYVKYHNGGGIYCDHSSPKLVNCILRENSANGMGGGMCNEYSSPTLTKCTFDKNSAIIEGGGMYNDHSNPTLVNCLFNENSAEQGGGMYNAVDSNPLMTNCIFSGNSSGHDGGGMYNYYGSDPTLIHCIFSKNSGYSGGGMINGGNATLDNCIFSGNLAGWRGGGMANGSSNPVLTNCIFIGNSAVNRGGGVDNLYSSPKLTNCILWGNTADGEIDELAQIYVSDDVSIDYSCIQGWTGALGGTGNIGTEPLFADSNNNDFHLLSQAGRWDPNSQLWVQDDVTSPCIDAGDPMSPIGYEPFPNGGIINMGAYGGTAEASKSYFDQPICETIVAGDINGDCRVNFADFQLMAFRWLEWTAP